jgi:hypothetical protein
MISTKLPVTVLVFLGGLALNLTRAALPDDSDHDHLFWRSGAGKQGLVTHSFLYLVGMAVTVPSWE